MAFTMIPVSSSQIESIGHEPETNTLAVIFKSGGLYHYSDVDASKFESMKSAESVGKFLGAHIKGKHDFRRVS